MAKVSKQGHANQFANRLQRIQAGGPNTNGTLMAGTYEDNMAGRGGAHYSVEKPPRSAMASLLITPVAVLFGAGAMLGGRAFRHHLEKNPDLVPADKAEIIMLTADVGVAAFLLLVLAYLFKLGSGLPRIGLMAGLLAVMLAEGKILEQAPEQFAMAFSPEYVADVTSRPAPIDDWADFTGDLATYLPTDKSLVAQYLPDEIVAKLPKAKRPVLAEASGRPTFITPPVEEGAEPAAEATAAN